jgi:hypothetical protein
MHKYKVLFRTTKPDPCKTQTLYYHTKAECVAGIAHNGGIKSVKSISAQVTKKAKVRRFTGPDYLRLWQEYDRTNSN